MKSELRADMFVFIMVVSLLQIVATNSDCPNCRASDRCEEKYEKYEGHTACLVDNPMARPIELTDEDRKDIVDYHNKLRATVMPKPANMLVMYWDDELEMLAKRWAYHCERSDTGHLKHDDLKFIPGSTPVGQNIGLNYNTFKDVTDAWFSEKWFYDMMLQRNFTSLSLVGHYTQIVWAETNSIGCAAVMCPYGKVHVCNYAPPGNIWPFLYPYIFAKKEIGENCPNKKQANGLCDCKKTICKNWGTLHVNNCTCTCSISGTRDDCGFYCEDDDPFPCGIEGKGYTDCNYFYTKYRCPHYCGSCPCEGRNYVSKLCKNKSTTDYNDHDDY